MAVEAQSATELERMRKQEQADAENAKRTGKGTRKRVGQTRGKSSSVVEWEAFDESQPDTLPKTLTEFMEITGEKDENNIVGYLISGYNDSQYTAASDPIADFISPTWPAEVQAAFRINVRSYVKMMSGTVSLDEAAAEMKSKLDKKYNK